MKTLFKIVCSVGLGVTLTSCGGPRNLIRQSDVAVTTEDERVLYLKKDPTGELIYNSWRSGAYGDSTMVYLVPPMKFETLLRRAKSN